METGPAMKESPIKVVTSQPYAVLILQVLWANASQSCIKTSPELDHDISERSGDRVMVDGNWKGRENTVAIIERYQAGTVISTMWREVKKSRRS